MINIIPNWHPFFVHFTVALLIVAVMIHLLLHLMPGGKTADQLTVVARWNMRIGTVFMLLTVAAGWYAYNTVSHDTPSHIAMTEHRNWAIATFVMFLAVTGWEYFLCRQSNNRSGLFTGLLAVAAVLLLSTAWHGGELVYRYGLGVMSMPQSESVGHTHEHVDSATSHNHDDTVNIGHAHDVAVEPDRNVSAVRGADAVPGKKPGHSHASGTAPHKD